MRRIYSFLVISLFVTGYLTAQEVPQGMKYQAVARDLKGEILANKPVSLRISLMSQKGVAMITHYSEFHEVVSNEVGLFNLVVGEGKSDGKITNVPWSNENIWMEVAILDQATGGYTVISQSKLMSVPYAFHAGTASKLAGSNGIFGKAPGNDSPSPTSGNSWNTNGNLGTNPPTDYIGTADEKDLVFKTNGVERFKITSDGQIITPPGSGLTLGGNLKVEGDKTTIDKDLFVGRNVVLNFLPDDDDGPYTTTPITGSTINRGNFTVSDMSATSLTGTLSVGKVATFNDVTNSTTKDDGSVVVKGGAGIAKDLHVGGSMNATSLSVSDNSKGYLATFINTNGDNGADAGDGIKIQLGKEKPLDLNGWTLPTYGSFFPGITGAIQNSLFDNGALNTSLNATTLFNNLKSGALSDFSLYGNMLVAGLCNLTNTVIDKVNDGIGEVNTALSLPYNLATPLNSGLGLPKNISSSINTALGLPKNLSASINSGLGLPITSGTVFGILDIFDDATIVPSLPPLSIPAVPALSIPALPDLILPKIPTIPKIDPCPPFENPFSFALNFPTLSSDPLTKNNEFIGFFDKNGEKVGAIRGQSMQDLVTELTDIPTLIHVATSLFVAFDFDAATANAVGFAKLAARAVDMVVNTWDKVGKTGVEYSSGNGDYAEWLERADPSEYIGTGDIIAVKGGKITKDIAGAEQIMAVSHHPIVLGNVPDEKRLPYGNNIAFMGQIPVKVMGPVKAGDFIVAKSGVPGYGVAVDPQNMRVEDYKLAVGRSWATDDHDGPKMVNTVVGVHNNSFLDLIKDLKEKTEENDVRLKAIEAKLNITSEASDKNERKGF